ncbi:MAG: 2'-deoxycytidine 5'-triphosphate deaminase [Alphaproteobacteria bacterium]|nr:2'-deoxycytidine 5'-triphosphate deaminase [Alphaproteobacteria bacterium]
MLNLFPQDTGSAGAALTTRTGILPYQALNAMRRNHEIFAVPDILSDQVQPASIDLRLGTVAYRVRASFLPGPQSTVMERIQQLDGYAIDLTSGAVLEKGCVYVVPLLEQLKLSPGLTGFANPKSSTGRLDILTRLITDRSTAFDQIERGYDGPLYVEIAPRTFSVVVRTGTRLNQARFRRGTPSLANTELLRLHKEGQLVSVGGETDETVAPSEPSTSSERQNIKEKLVGVTIDLQGKGPGTLVGYRAKKHTDRIDVEKISHYDPEDFWEPIHSHRDLAIILNPDDFYILVTREAVGVPPDLAAEMVAYDTTVGEFRVHYAGFFDPGFGWDSSAGGSKAVLEVRSHEVPFMLEHGQTVGWLRYEPMAARPDRLYGSGIGSNYQNQGLQLAKQFRRPGG